MESWIPAMNQRTIFEKPLNLMLKFVSWALLGYLYIQKSTPLTGTQLYELSPTERWDHQSDHTSEYRQHPKTSVLSSGIITMWTSDHFNELCLFVLYIFLKNQTFVTDFIHSVLCVQEPSILLVCVFHSTGCVSMSFLWVNIFLQL